MLLGYSQKRVARLLGLKDTAILSRWENGVSVPTIENLFKLSVVYHTLTEELYKDLYLDVQDDIELKAKQIAQKMRAEECEEEYQ